MEEKEVCPICGHDVTNEDKKCGSCGEPLVYVVKKSRVAV